MHFLDKKEDPGPMDDEDVWALMARMSAQRDMERKAQDHLTVVLDENLPYGIALTGDWHIGMEGVLYDEMDADFTALAGLPGLLALGMGDYAIGSYYPRDIEIIARSVSLEFVVLVTGSSLFGKMVYDPAGAQPGWRTGSTPPRWST